MTYSVSSPVEDNDRHGYSQPTRAAFDELQVELAKARADVARLKDMLVAAGVRRWLVDLVLAEAAARDLPA